MQAYVGVRSSHPDQMGRVEIGLLDENSDYVARISMNDVHWQAEQNTGFAKLGNKKKPNSERVLINEPGDHPTTWNQYRGRLWLARTAIGGKLIFQSFYGIPKRMIQSALSCGKMKTI